MTDDPAVVDLDPALEDVGEPEPPIRVQSVAGYRPSGILYYKVLTGDSTRVYDKLFGEKPLA